jgi:hypothetical protein
MFALVLHGERLEDVAAKDDHEERMVSAQFDGESLKSTHRREVERWHKAIRAVLGGEVKLPRAGRLMSMDELPVMAPPSRYIESVLYLLDEPWSDVTIRSYLFRRLLSAADRLARRGGLATRQPTLLNVEFYRVHDHLDETWKVAVQVQVTGQSTGDASTRTWMCTLCEITLTAHDERIETIEPFDQPLVFCHRCFYGLDLGCNWQPQKTLEYRAQLTGKTIDYPELRQ